MPSASSYNIEIKTTADLAGVKAQIAAQEELIAQAQRMGVSSHGAEADLGRLKDTAAQLSRQNQEENKKETISLHEKKEALHALLESVGAQVPGLGLLFAPELASLTLLYTGIDLFRESLKKEREEMVESIKSQQEWVTSLEEARRATAQMVSTAAADYERSLTRINTLEEQAKQASADRLEAINREADRTKSLATAHEQLYDAQLKVLQARGLLSASAVTEQEFQNKLHAEDQQHAADHKAAVKDLVEKEKELNRQKGARETDETKAAGIRNSREYQDRATNINKGESAIEKADIAFKASAQEVAELQAKLTQQSEWIAKLRKLGLTGAADPLIMEALAAENEEFRGKVKTMNSNQGALDSLRDTQFHRKREQADADAQIKDFEDEARDLKKSGADLAHAIDQAATKIKETADQHAEQRRLELETHRADRLAADIAASAKDPDAAARADYGQRPAGRDLANEVTSAILRARAALQQPQQHLAEMPALLNELAGLFENQAISNQAIQKQLETLFRAVSALQQSHSNINTRISVNRAP